MELLKRKHKIISSSLFLFAAQAVFPMLAQALENPYEIVAPGPNSTEPRWTEADDGHWVLRDIEYCSREDLVDADTGEREPVPGPKATLHVPADFSPLSTYPVVVFFHGAGGNQNSSFPDTVLTHLAQQGFIGLSASYREVTDFSAVFGATKKVRRDFIQSAADGRCAIRWARALSQADNPLRVDPNKIVAAGWSLGTMVAQNAALSPVGDVKVCVNDNASIRVETTSSWRLFLHRALKHDLVVVSNESCTFEISELQWDVAESLIGATESQWNDTADGVQALVPISTTSDLLNLSSECALMHSDFGTYDFPALPLPVSPQGESRCQRFKHVARTHNVLLPHLEDVAKSINGDFFENAWRNVAESMMWVDSSDEATSFLSDQYSDNAETIVPFEHYMLASTRSWIEKWSPIDALPLVINGDLSDEIDEIIRALNPVHPIPTLLIAGSDDKATLWEETVSLGIRLRAAGFPTQVVVFNDDSHGLSNSQNERDNLISGFLNRVFGVVGEDSESWLGNLCGQRTLDGASIDCLKDRSTVNRPFIFPVSTLSHVSPPHHWPNGQEDFSSRVAPLELGNYNATNGIYTLYSNMSYEFGGVDFETTTSGYANQSEFLEWSVGGTANTNDFESCTGSKVVVTTRTQIEERYDNTCYFQLEPGTAYILSAVGATQAAYATLQVENHPYGGVQGARYEPKSALWGLIKWHEVRWSDLTTYSLPGGRVSIFIDSETSATSMANQSSVATFYSNRAENHYKLCYTGTETCSIIPVN